MRIFVASALIFLSLVSFAHPLESFTAFGSTVDYTRPDPAKWNLVRNGIDEKSKKYLVMFEHTPIKDPQGRSIKPVIAIICEAVPDSVDVIRYSIAKRAHTPFKVNKMMSHHDGSFQYRNTVGYEGQYTRKVGHKVFVAHMRHGSAGLQVICDSTDGVYDKVEAEMRSFLRSIMFRE